MEEQEKWQRIKGAFNKYLIKVLIETFFEELIRKWTKELRKEDSDKVVTLPEFTGKPVEIITCLFPGIELYDCAGDEPEIGVIVRKEDTTVFIFRKMKCVKAFRILNEQLPEVMSEELTEDFRRLFYLTGRKFEGKPTWKRLPPDDTFKWN